MNEPLYIILALLAGLLMGALFFGGLWLTVKKSVTSNMPAVLLLGSFLFRTGITMAGFYFICRGNWQRLLAGMIGFIAGRFIILRLTRPAGTKQIQLRKEGPYEIKS